MRAARIERYGGPEELSVVEVPDPVPAAGQVVVTVHGSSINPVDLAIRNGWMQEFLPLDLPLTLGADVAGTISAIGDDVADLAVGDPVYGVAGVAMGGSGGFADLALTAAGMVARAPLGVGPVAAGTLPLAGVSALQALAEEPVVKPGDRVLIHGAAGGVGLIAIELARHLGAHVSASAHGAGLAAVAEVGADEVIDTDTSDLDSVEPFDLTLDLVGSDPALPVRVTRAGGRVVALLVPPDAEAASAKGVDVTLQATAVTTERLDRLTELIEESAIRPHVAQVVTLADIARAFTLKETGGTPGKIAIAVR